MDDIHIRRAIGMGILLAINSDAHNPGALDTITLGVATARRGWAEPRHILNTLPADDLRARLKREKSL